MSYFKTDNQYLYLEAPYAEFYIPKVYFDGGRYAEDRGSIIETLGLFHVGIFKNGELQEMKIFNAPTMLNLFVNDSEERDVKLPGNNDGLTPCKVIKYNKGHKITDAGVIQDASNVESFLDLIIKGKIPNNIPYNETLNIWRRNQELNGAHLGVPSVILELILSVTYRDKDDPGRKFSRVIGANPETSPFAYVTNNFRQVCQYTSTFAGLTFEDIDSMISTSLNRTRNHGEEAYSPLESLLKQ